ncbi:replicative DNA helicase [Deinococcus sp. Arct2-2]|uniref:replicative DNA helicase n=1 Tax=Deinococcus sp. Arct2-2 TaxID=2568653 RepID=UPI0010A311A1|nr:DnaB-like helicase C-terminal domain-containing protein [Deinococcus sp. Arct2-2]THF70473.1 replicative DNA helicase [Deinococcus sp. Arct2-2]
MTTVDQLGARIAPHDDRAEVAVLGGVLLDNEQWRHVSDLPAEAFQRESHRIIWLAMHALMQAGKGLDLVGLSGHLERLPARISGRNALDEAGGLTYLIGLGESVPYAYRTAEYAHTVRDLYARRLLLTHAGRASAMIYGVGMDPQPTETIQDFLANVPTPAARVTSNIVTGAAADQGALEYVRQLAAGHSPALRTGYPDLDSEFCGFHPGSLTVLGARPSMGKSSLAIGIAERVALSGRYVQVLSLEMKASQIAVRQLSHAARVPLKEALNGQATSAQLDRLEAAAERRAARNLPAYMDQPDTTLPAVERLARHLKDAGRLDFLVIDYLGLISVPGRDGDENDTQKLGIISRGLKTLAIQLDIPVLVLHQLNRSLEARQNKRPEMADLRQSGRIEEDADNILFVYRDEYYNPNTADLGVAEIIIGKQRQGPRKVTAKLKFHAESATFQSLAAEHALL